MNIEPEKRDRLLGSKAVREHFNNISDTTLSQWVKRGVIPEPVKINGRNYWHESGLAAPIKSAPSPA